MCLYTDFGSLYTVIEVGKWLETNEIRHSFLTIGMSYDNTGIEFSLTSLKKEGIYAASYSDFEKLVKEKMVQSYLQKYTQELDSKQIFKGKKAYIKFFTLLYFQSLQAILLNCQ